MEKKLAEGGKKGVFGSVWNCLEIFDFDRHNLGILFPSKLKGCLRITQTFIDTYAKVGFAKLYTTKIPITSADLLNDKVLPFYDQHQLPLLRILTDRGTEYCGKAETHDYRLYLAINDIEHTKTKARHMMGCHFSWELFISFWLQSVSWASGITKGFFCFMPCTCC
jgi:hypothetical protein